MHLYFKNTINSSFERSDIFVKRNDDLVQWLNENLKNINLVDNMKQEHGFTRLGFSMEELKAMEEVRSIAESLGLLVHRDEAGNYIARWEGNGGPRIPAVAIGSHVDTVVNGGGYDGVAGVLCALGAVKILKEEGYTPSHPIEVTCFASEESARFGVSTIGSKAMSGLLNKEAIAEVQDTDGLTIKEVAEKQGLEWKKIDRAERSAESIKSFMELHIEQGTRIENAGAHFGIAQAVACPTRLIVQIHGRAGHTGTTPMEKRQDAMVAAAPLISFVSQAAEQLSTKNDFPVVATTSTLHVQPNVMNVIPGQVEMRIDIRSIDDHLKEKMVSLIYDQCAHLEQAYGVESSIDILINQPSVHLDKKRVAKLKQLGESLGYTGFVMESGAGHDVMNMARKWPAGLIFIPCKGGISHHPEERALLKDLEMGVHIITAYLRSEASD